jgi:hypothetical protein
MFSRDEIIQQILDRAKRSWNKNDDAGGDADVFYSEIVVTLRNLRAEGLFETLHEHRGSRHGLTRIDRVDIRGSINYNFREQEVEADQEEADD